jgi:branched-chain amino acid transport system permease protein
MTDTAAARLRLGAIAALAVFALLVPFMFGSYRVGQLTLVLAYAIAILGLNLLVGYAGQVSLGHGAFFALGAYTAAILIEDVGFPHLLAVPIAGAVGLVAGILFGIPTLRLRGLYLALVTLGLAVATPPIIKRLDGLTGGSQGINVAQPEAPAFLGLAQDQWVYLLTLAFAVPMFVLAANLVRSRVGRALMTIRDNEIVARSMGVNLTIFKTGAFAVSAAYGAVAGALFVFNVAFVSPEAFTLVLSISFLAAVVVGGLATVEGALLGALFIVLVPEYSSDVNQALSGVVYGAVLILCMWLLPGGAADLARRAWARATRGGDPRGGLPHALEPVTESTGIPGAGPPGRGRNHAGS